MEEASASNEASTSNANAAVAVAARRSQRKRRVDAESEQPESNHPHPNAKDASVYSIQSLLMLQSRNANYFNKLDFVYVSDDDIEQLFVTDRVRHQLNNRILYHSIRLLLYDELQNRYEISITTTARSNVSN